MTRLLLPLILVAALVWVAFFWHRESDALQVTLSLRDANAYGMGFTDPYWPTMESPKLVTPQWIGEEGVEAAAVLSIDDMRSIEPYRRFLQPILERLEQIDGRAPVSIFTNEIDPGEPQLQDWLERGLSLEVHTIAHPCPLLQGGDLAKARDTVHRCIDLLQGIPDMRPVAYRMPCCDSMNSVSPRFFDEVMAPLTPGGHFLSCDSSVFQIFTGDDPDLPRELFAGGKEKRFERYVPLGKDFVNTIENYPYPYVIAGQHWQFPCTVPSDWEAQHLQGNNHPGTVEDLKAALDASVAKQGLFVLVFHPHGWIENGQIVDLIDHAQKTHGERLKFLNMREVQERIDRHLLGNRPIRRADGSRSGTRLLDVNRDGYMDVTYEDGAGASRARIWVPGLRTWRWHRVVIDERRLAARALGEEFDRDAALRLWDLDGDGELEAIYSDAERFALFRRRDDRGWEVMRRGDRTAENAPPPFIRADGSNSGVWMDRSGFIIQNENTSDELNVIRRVAFKDILAEATEPAREDSGLLGAKPLDPEAALASMRVKPGLEIQLAVHEPLVMDPIDIAWGADGKLWVVEMADYPTGLDDEGRAGGRVRYLEDEDRDGHYEKSTLFLQGLPYPTSVMPWRRGALVLAAPDLLYAEDVDGDGGADRREVLYSGFGQGNQQHRANSLRWGLDNWVYLANGDSGGEVRSVKTGQTVSLGHHDLRIRPDEGLLELTSGRTQYGRNRNDAGDWFGCNNSNPLWHYVLDHAALKGNAHFTPPGPIVHLPKVPGNAPVFPISVTHERFNDFHAANRITSACGAMIYRASLLGEAYRDNAFIGEPVHNLVHRQVLKHLGVTFTGLRASDEQTSEFLSSSDPWFRPVSMHTAPDGALWVVDMYRHVIEHPEWIPSHWEERLDLRAGHDRGRLYRIAPKGHHPEPMPDLTAMEVEDLAAMLGDDSGTIRDLAQRLIIERKPSNAESPLIDALAASDWRTRLHALATFDGLKLATKPMISAALEDPHPAVRRLAVRLAGKLKGDWHFPRDEDDPKVLLEKAIALGELQGQGRALAELALQTQDPYTRAACVSSMLADTEGFMDGLTETTFTEDHSQLLQWVVSTPGGAAIARRLSATGELEIWRFELVQRALPELGREIEPMLRAAQKALADREADAALRSAALELLCAAGVMGREMEPLATFCRPEEPLALQMTAARMMAEHLPEIMTDWLLPAWPELEPDLRGQLKGWLNSRPALALRVVEKLADQPIGDLIRSLARHPDGGVRQAAAALLDHGSHPDHSRLTKAVSAAQGRRQGGQLLFRQACAICHALEGEGNAIGPDLAALADPSPEFLLNAILSPNEAVEDKYLAYVAETKTGETTIGLLEGESGATLRLRLANGESQELLRRDVKRLTSTGLSLMPEGLAASLTPQDLADLIAYIGSARPPRKTFEFNHPALVRPAGDHSIVLAATAASVHGPSLAFERRYMNLGMWKHVQDQAVWSFHCSQPGRYAVSIRFACDDGSAGNTLLLRVSGQRLAMTVPGTGTWDQYRDAVLGEFDLNAGEHELVARSQGSIQNFLIDIRTVVLKPLASGDGS